MKKKKFWVTFWFCVLYPFQTGRISTGAPVEVLRSERYLPMNSRWTPMNFWAKVTHLDPYSLIESSSVFNGGSRGRNPVWKASRWTPMKMPMKFWVLRAAATYTYEIRWADCRRCHRRLVWKGGEKFVDFYERNSPRWFIGSSTGAYGWSRLTKSVNGFTGSDEI